MPSKTRAIVIDPSTVSGALHAHALDAAKRGALHAMSLVVGRDGAPTMVIRGDREVIAHYLDHAVRQLIEELERSEADTLPGVPDPEAQP